MSRRLDDVQKGKSKEKKFVEMSSECFRMSVGR